MPSLKETKDRIVSVNSTRKITSAMKMVASSKLHHAQTLISNMLPYEKSLEHILKSFLAAMPDVRTSQRSPRRCEACGAGGVHEQQQPVRRFQQQRDQTDGADCRGV